MREWTKLWEDLRDGAELSRPDIDNWISNLTRSRA